MKKAKIFIGPAMSGKTRKAKEISSQYVSLGKHVAIFTAHQKFTKRTFDTVEPDTELMIVDNISKVSIIEDFMNIVVDGLRIIRKGTNESFLIRPDIILICHEDITAAKLPSGISIEKRFDVIQFPTDLEIQFSSL